MELSELLKELKNIEPDSEYSRRSKEIILVKRNPAWPSFNAWRILVACLQSGSVIALSVVILLIALGGFSLWKTFSPYGLAGLDQVGLRAEAHNIDIQIQLTNVAYNEPVYSANNALVNKTSTAATAPNRNEIQSEAQAKAVQIGLSSLSSSSSTPVTVDEALKELAQ